MKFLLYKSPILGGSNPSDLPGPMSLHIILFFLKRGTTFPQNLYWRLHSDHKSFFHIIYEKEVLRIQTFKVQILFGKNLNSTAISAIFSHNWLSFCAKVVFLKNPDDDWFCFRFRLKKELSYLLFDEKIFGRRSLLSSSFCSVEQILASTIYN